MQNHLELSTDWNFKKTKQTLECYNVPEHFTQINHTRQIVLYLQSYQGPIEDSK